MNKERLIECLQKEMQLTSADIKAEAQLFVAQSRGLQPHHYLVSCERRFRREYSRDIAGTEMKEDAKKQTYLEISLSRSGIYEQLPEGLFFPPAPPAKNVNDLATEYRTNQKKQSAIRKFFQPFEHDFFLQRLNIEMEENLLLEGLQSGILNEYFIKFWGLPASVPSHLLSPLILLLPYAHKIAGDTQLTASCLEQILREKVIITRKNSIQQACNIQTPALGEAALGLDFVCGNTFVEDTPLFDIQVGPLKHSVVSEYLAGGHRAKLLETFYRFFIPAGVDVNLQVQIAPEKKQMELGEQEAFILGYSSYL